MCHDTKQWCKIWRRNYLFLQKWCKEFGEFSCKHSKVSKLALWWVPLVQNILMHELKTYRGVMRNNNEKWYRIWSGIDLSFQKWHEDFSPGPLEISLKICTLMDSFCPKYKTFELKNYRAVKCADTEEWHKIWRRTWLSLQKWHKKFGEFSPGHLRVSKSALWWPPYFQSV